MTSLDNMGAICVLLAEASSYVRAGRTRLLKPIADFAGLH